MIMGFFFLGMLIISGQQLMQDGSVWLLDGVSPIIKLVKDREQLFFELLSFVTTHIAADSNDLDTLTIFHPFLARIDSLNDALTQKQLALLAALEGRSPVPLQPVAREMLRLSSRIVEMLEASAARVRASVFQQGRAGREVARVKSCLAEMLRRQSVEGRQYCEYIINFTAKKFARQAHKLHRYLEKVAQGENTCLRDFYAHPRSDSDERRKEQHPLPIPIRRVDFKLDIKRISPEAEKKPSVKKTIKPSTKRRQRRRQKGGKLQVQREEEGEGRQQTANKLLKFYALLQLNKKEFLEDYIYEQAQEQRHRKELLLKLVQRNKQVNSQINNYVRKSAACLQVPLIVLPPNRSSGDQRNDSLASRNSLRTSFVISKRKPSFHLQTADKKHFSQSEKKQSGASSQREAQIKKVGSRRRSSHSNHRPAQSKKKLFVVKQPLVFEDDVIPELNTTQWLHAPLPHRFRGRNQSLRLKKKPNPAPMGNAVLADSFRYQM